MKKLQSSLVDKLTTRDQDLKGRKITGSAPSSANSDLTTRKEVKDWIDNLSQQLSSLQKSMSGGEFISANLPLELVSKHTGVSTASGYQFLIGDGNVGRRCITFLSYNDNEQYIVMGAKWLNGASPAWIATDTTAVMLKHSGAGLVIYTSSGNTVGNVCSGFIISGQFLNGGTFGLNTGQAVNNIVTTIGTPGLDTNLATEKAIRLMLNGASGTVVLMDSSTTFTGNLTIGYTFTPHYKTLVFVNGLCTSIT